MSSYFSLSDLFYIHLFSPTFPFWFLNKSRVETVKQGWQSLVDKTNCEARGKPRFLLFSTSLPPSPPTPEIRGHFISGLPVTKVKSTLKKKIKV